MLVTSIARRVFETQVELGRICGRGPGTWFNVGPRYERAVTLIVDEPEIDVDEFRRRLGVVGDDEALIFFMSNIRGRIDECGP